MFLSFVLDPDNVKNTTHKLSVVHGKKSEYNQNEHEFVWKLDPPVVAEFPISSLLRFWLYLVPHYHWRTVDIICDGCGFTFNGTNETICQNVNGLEGWIQLHYKASKVYSVAYQGLMVQFTLYAIVVFVQHYDVVATSLQDQENHKVLAFVSLNNNTHDKRDLGISLGRAQTIKTTQHNGLRVYRWESSTTNNAFPGISRRSSFVSHVEDVLDWHDLTQTPLVTSPRRLPLRDYVPDSDAYHNNNHVLPIYIQKQKSVTLQFCNAKYKPSPFIEYTIMYKELLAIKKELVPRRRWSVSERKKSMATESQRRVLSYEMMPLVRCNVCCSVCDDDHTFIIDWIELVVDAYNVVLPSMGQNVVPLTTRK